MTLRDKFPDFFRLSKDLRAMKFDFDKPSNIRRTVKRVKLTDDFMNFDPFDKSPMKIKTEEFEETEYIENPEAIVADDVDLEEATLLTSRHRFGRGRSNGKGMHRVVLDLDMDAALIPSSTPGHHHLIIDRTMPWEDYEKLLKVLADVGIIEKGYANASISKGYTGIRPPWVKKEYKNKSPGKALTDEMVKKIKAHKKEKEELAQKKTDSLLKKLTTS